MKLKLNNSLRAALMACYALAAPIATTITTGAIATGVTLTLLAPQAQADEVTYAGTVSNTGAFTDAGGTSQNIFNSAGTDFGTVEINMNPTDSTTSTYFATPSGICTSDLVVTAWNLNNGNGGCNYMFQGAITGSATIKSTYTGTGAATTRTLAYFFAGDMSGFSGDIELGLGTLLQFGNYDAEYYRDTDTGLGSYEAYTGATGNAAVSGTGTITHIGSCLATALTYNYDATQTATIANAAINSTSTAGYVLLEGGAAYNIATTMSVAGTLMVTEGSSATITAGSIATNNLQLGTAADGDVEATSGSLTVDADQTLSITGAVTSYGESSLTNSGTLNLAAGVTLTADASLDVTLGGLVSVVEAGQIVVNDLDSFTLDADVIFDLSEAIFTTSGDDFVLQLITAGDGVDLSDIFDGFTSANVSGLDSGVEVSFGDDGTISYSLGQVLSYTQGGDFTWTTTAGEGSQDFINSSGETQGYTSGAILTVSGSPAHATLGSNVDPKQLVIDGIEFTLTGDGNKMNSDQVSFVGSATLTLTDDALGSDAVIGTGNNTAATVKFAATDATTAFNYSDQMNGFAGNVVVSNGIVTIGESEGGNSTLGFNTVTVSGGELNLDLALNTSSITVTGGEANFGGAVTTNSVSISGGETTFDVGMSLAALTVSSGSVTFGGDTTVTSITSMNANKTDETINVVDNATLTINNEFYTGNTTFNVESGSILSLTNRLDTGGGYATFTGGGTVNIDRLLVSGSTTASGLSAASTVKITDGTTVNVTSTSTVVELGYVDNATFTAAIEIGEADAATGAAVSTLNLANSLYLRNSSGAASITVYSNGVLNMDKGLTTSKSSDSVYSATMSVYGTLALGNQTDAADDYSDAIAVTMQSGSTLQALDATTTVATTLNFADNGTVTFAGNGNFLDITSDIVASTTSAAISGNVDFSGETSLGAVTVASGAGLSLSGDYIFNEAITNNGTVTISSTATFDITALLDLSVAGTDLTLTLIDGGSLSMASGWTVESLFTEDSLAGLSDYSFSAGVFTYTIAQAITDIVYSTGGTLDLAVGTTVGEATYTDASEVTINTADTTLNMTGDIAPASLTIGDGITVDVTASGEYTLNSSDITIGAGSTLEVATDLLGDAVSFANSDASSTLSLDLGAGTLENFKNIDGFTGDLVISNGTLTMTYAGEGNMDFASITVEAGSTFQLANGSLSTGATITLDGSGEGVATLSASNSSITSDIAISGDAAITSAGSVVYLTGDITNDSTSDVLNITSGTGTNGIDFQGDVNYTGSINILAGDVKFSGTISGAIASLSMADGTSLTASTSAFYADSVSATGAATLSLGATAYIGDAVILSAADISMSNGSVISSTAISGITTTGTLGIYGAGTSVTMAKDTTVGTFNMSMGAAGSTTLTIEDGADFTVTDSISLSKYTGDNTINVSGTMTVNTYLSTNDGSGTINVLSGGTLQLDKGLMGIHLDSSGTYHGTGSIAIVVKDGATISVGNQESYTAGAVTYGADYDYNTVSTTASSGGGSFSSVTLEMKDGATIMDNGVAEVTTVYQTINYESGCTAKFETSGAGQTLVMASAVGNSSDARIAGAGTVEFAGGGTLNGLTVVEGSSLTISSAVTATSLANDGAVTVVTDGTLTLSTAYGDGTLTLAGGTLSVSTGSLSTDINVSANSSLASLAGRTDISSTITLGEGVQLDLTNAGELGLQTGFGLDMSSYFASDWSIDADTDYTIFTGLTNDISSGFDSYVTGLDDTDYNYAWSYDSDTKELVLNVTLQESAPTDSEWNQETGNYDIATNTETPENLTIDTSDTDAGTTPEIKTGDTTSGTTTTGAVVITGNKDVAITGDNDLDSTTITVGDGTNDIDVTVSTGVSATEGMDIKAGSTVTVDDTGSITETKITLAANATLDAGVITVSGNGATVDGTVTKDVLSNAVISGASIVVNGTPTVTGGSLAALLAGDSYNYSGYGIMNGGSLQDASSVTLTNSAQLTMNNVVVGADTTFTANDSTTTGLVLNSNAIEANNVSSLDGSNLSLTGSGTATNSVASLTIDTFDSLTSNTNVDITGSLALVLTLDADTFNAVAGYWSGGDYFDIVLDFGDANVTYDGCTVQVYLYNEDYTDSYILTAGSVSGTSAAVGSDGSFLVVTIPEPSTATLSLLALAGLLARRRRKA